MVVMFNKILKTVKNRNIEDSYLLGMQCCANWQIAESLSMLLWAPQTLKEVLLSIFNSVLIVPVLLPSIVSFSTSLENALLEV